MYIENKTQWSWLTGQLQEIDRRQHEMINRAEREKRGFGVDEEREWRELDKRYGELERERGKYELSSEPIKPSPMNSDRRDNTFDRRTTKMQKNNIDLSPERRDFYSYLHDGESRTLQVQLDKSGGFATVPEVVLNEIIHDLDNEIFVRQLARKFIVQSPRQSIPLMSSDIGDATFTNEVNEASLDTQMDFQRRNLAPRRLVKAIKVSNLLREIGATNFGDFVTQRLRYKIGVAMENGFLTGNGIGPLGMFETSNDGISSSRNVSTGNTTTAITADGLINALYNLKSQYIRSASCRWIFHRDALKMIRKLKDGSGEFLWQAGIGMDRPSTILGIPYILSEYAPNTFTSGERVALVGDLNFYGICEINSLKVQVLLEKYALEGCTGYIAEMWVDGGPLLENAFSMVTLA
jgi:HK97 family phage major capsid protein